MNACLVRSATWFLAVVCSAALYAADAESPALPEGAQAEDILFFFRADLASADLAGLRRAIERNLTDERPTDIMFVRNYEIAQQKLLAAGVQSVLFVEGFDRPELFLCRDDKAKVPAVKTALLECTRGIRPRISAWGLEFAETGPWIMAKPRTQPAAPGISSDERLASLNAALGSIGKYPGIAVVPPANLQQVLDQRLSGAKAALPPEVWRCIEAARRFQWIAVRVRLSEKPALHVVIKLPDEKAAAELAAAFPPMLKTATALMEAQAKLAKAAEMELEETQGNADESEDASATVARPAPAQRSPGQMMLAIAQQLNPEVKGSRVTLTTDAKTSLQILDFLFVAERRAALSGLNPDIVNSYLLHDWLLEVYPFQHGRWATKLDDLKPLLSDDPKQQAEAFRTLLTDSQGNFPTYAYTSPEKPYDAAKAPSPDSEGEGPRGAAVLVELKDGKPRKPGTTLYENGERAITE